VPLAQPNPPHVNAIRMVALIGHSTAHTGWTRPRASPEMIDHRS
jgi:hypothetical protein